MLRDGIQARLPRLLPREALLPTLFRGHPSARPQSGIDRLERLGIWAHVLQSITRAIESTVHTASQPVQQRLCRPPFWACRLRSSESRTSCKASRIRKPGGRSGPPWLSLSIPRTAAQYPSTTSPASSSTGAFLGGCPRIRVGQNLTSQNAPESTIGNRRGVLLPPKMPIFAFLGQAPRRPIFRLRRPLHAY